MQMQKFHSALLFPIFYWYKTNNIFAFSTWYYKSEESFLEDENTDKKWKIGNLRPKEGDDGMEGLHKIRYSQEFNRYVIEPVFFFFLIKKYDTK